MAGQGVHQDKNSQESAVKEKDGIFDLISKHRRTPISAAGILKSLPNEVNFTVARGVIDIEEKNALYLPSNKND
jgi:hypothetical protein